jgi:hypothetical protein
MSLTANVTDTVAGLLLSITETNYNNIPGWRLPRMWLQSMPTSGLLRVTFTSLEPKCEPVWAERRRQAKKVLTYC